MLKFSLVQVLAILSVLQFSSPSGAEELSPGESRPVGEAARYASEEIISQRAPSFEAWRRLQTQSGFNPNDVRLLELVDDRYDAQIRPMREEPLPRERMADGSEVNVIEIGRNRFTVPYGPQTDEQREAYRQLQMGRMVGFEQTRAFILRSMARLMSWGNLGFGAFVVTRERVRGFIDRRESLRTGWHHLTHPIAFMQAIMSRQSLPRVEARGPVYPEFQLVLQNANDRVAADRLRQLGALRINQVLVALDQTLKDRATVVSQSHEFGIQASVGLQLESGVGTLGRGGALMVGLGIGVDSKNKRLVVELFRETEAFQRAYTPVATAAVQTKLFAYAQSREVLSSPAERWTGVGFYPPAPIGKTESNRHHIFATGIADSSIGFPSFLSAGFVYENRITHSPVLLVTMSLRDKGFFRMHSSLFSWIRGVRSASGRAANGVAANASVDLQEAQRRLELAERAMTPSERAAHTVARDRAEAAQRGRASLEIVRGGAGVGSEPRSGVPGEGGEAPEVRQQATRVTATGVEPLSSEPLLEADRRFAAVPSSGLMCQAIFMPAMAR
ncbi:MAG TPA: hypothetical protein PLZ57_15240 [Pseudobdellovibrionaceae bacterium]|nr:hypothetical protein [Pseudobdellovibrionaceae bacterium]